MGFLKEFKEFAIKGNVIDLAVGLMIGAAFTTIVNSVIKDLVMPIIAAVLGVPDFSNAYIDLKNQIPDGTPLEKAREIGPVFAYGNFLTVVINFILVAIAIFMIVKAINKLKRTTPPPPPALSEITTTDKLLIEIRDLLKNETRNS